MHATTHQPPMQLAILSRQYVVSRSIHALAQLGVADWMSETPIPVEEIAEKSGTVPELLDRILNYLSSYGLFIKQDKSYGLTALSKPLKKDDPHSIQDVLKMADDAWWKAFAHLDKTLKTGKPGFELEHGMQFFEFLGENPERQANFDRGMARLSTYDDEAIAETIQGHHFQSLADIGGGQGGLATAIALQNPEMKVILFDTIHVIEQLNGKTLPKNMIMESGDFFSDLPQADAYLYKGVLHDFNDADTRQILSNCRAQMRANSVLLIAEQIIPDIEGPHPNKTMDLVMLMLLGGRQRTQKEWRELVEPLGFQLRSSHPTASIFTVLEFKAA